MDWRWAGRRLGASSALPGPLASRSREVGAQCTCMELPKIVPIVVAIGTTEKPKISGVVGPSGGSQPCWRHEGTTIGTALPLVLRVGDDLLANCGGWDGVDHRRVISALQLPLTVIGANHDAHPKVVHGRIQRVLRGAARQFPAVAAKQPEVTAFVRPPSCAVSRSRSVGERVRKRRRCSSWERAVLRCANRSGRFRAVDPCPVIMRTVDDNGVHARGYHALIVPQRAALTLGASRVKNRNLVLVVEGFLRGKRERSVFRDI